MAATIDEIEEMVSVQLGRKGVRAGDRIIEDLDAESADVVNIVAALEDRYGIFIPEEELPDVRTVADMLALVKRHEG